MTKLYSEALSNLASWSHSSVGFGLVKTVEVEGEERAKTAFFYWLST